MVERVARLGHLIAELRRARFGRSSEKLSADRLAMAFEDIRGGSLALAWAKGALIHLTNPKAVMVWGSILAVGMRPGAGAGAVIAILTVCLAINVTLTTTSALLFSSPAVTRAYLRLRRWLEATFATVFGDAAAHLLVAREP